MTKGIFGYTKTSKPKSVSIESKYVTLKTEHRKTAIEGMFDFLKKNKPIPSRKINDVIQDYKDNKKDFVLNINYNNTSEYLKYLDNLVNEAIPYLLKETEKLISGLNFIKSKGIKINDFLPELEKITSPTNKLDKNSSVVFGNIEIPCLNVNTGINALKEAVSDEDIDELSEEEYSLISATESIGCIYDFVYPTNLSKEENQFVLEYDSSDWKKFVQYVEKLISICDSQISEKLDDKVYNLIFEIVKLYPSSVSNYGDGDEFGAVVLYHHSLGYLYELTYGYYDDVCKTMNEKHVNKTEYI